MTMDSDISHEETGTGNNGENVSNQENVSIQENVNHGENVSIQENVSNQENVNIQENVSNQGNVSNQENVSNEVNENVNNVNDGINNVNNMMNNNVNSHLENLLAQILDEVQGLHDQLEDVENELTDTEEEAGEVDDDLDTDEELDEIFHLVGDLIGDLDEGSDSDEDNPVEVQNDSESDNEADETNAVDYDQSLPVTHSYMGADMEDLKGRTIRDDGEVMLMPLVYKPDIVLVPGQILPLVFFHPQPIFMMEKVIAGDKTFGLIFGKSDGRSRLSNSSSFSSVGVTCEIFSAKQDVQHGVMTMSIKAEGRQRFELLSKEAQFDGALMGRIKILPDVYLPACPPSSLLYTQYTQASCVRSQIVNNNYLLQNHKWKDDQARYMIGFQRKTIPMLCSSLTPYPGWVYKLYNPYFLMDCLLHEIRSWNNNIDLNTLPTDPTSFSHWITSNLPLTNNMKIELLEINATPLRLRRQIEIINQCATGLSCDKCSTIVADKNDLFSLSKRGPMDAYVNPQGHVHETVTFYKAQNISLHGRSSTEYSWFPGYAWTVAICKRCRNHLGWKFKASKKDLVPRKFWGLTRASLRPVFKEASEEESVKLKEHEENDESPAIPHTTSFQYESSI